MLGQVLEAADGDFNTLLELGFATSIRREYAWRTERGRVDGQPARRSSTCSAEAVAGARECSMVALLHSRSKATMPTRALRDRIVT